MRKACVIVVLMVTSSIGSVQAWVPPVRSNTGMVISTSNIASQVGAQVLKDGGNAIDAAVATAFALAVTHPSAGNIGGGGFLLYRSAMGEAAAYDFRETAPERASPTMFIKEGNYNATRHHNSYLSVGVPGTVAGLHLAWREKGKLPWKRLVEPAIILAQDGFPVSDGLARSLARVLPEMQKYPSSVAQFSKAGVPFSAGDLLKQPVLASTLQRIASQGPAGFYQGPIAEAFEREMLAHDGLITREDLKRYSAIRRMPVQGTYRGYDVIAMPPPTSGGVTLIEMLNLLEGYDLASMGAGSALSVHLMAESMKRAFADRAALLGDPDFNRDIPLARLLSKPYADELRKTISREHATKSSPTTFELPKESDETTQISVVDSDCNAVSMTYTIEDSYGVKIVLPEGGFLLNNEMGDFNAAPNFTTADGLIGTPANLAQPGKRMLSSMSPTILLKDGRLFMVTGSPGGRTIINTVLETIVNVIDFGMNAQEAVDAGRFHHQWFPDHITYEKYSLSPDTLAVLRAMGHEVEQGGNQGVAEVIVYNTADHLLEGGVDRRQPDGAAASPRQGPLTLTSSSQYGVGQTGAIYK
jgi:gamma-glutamyltranspeptidase / glutathione hydrolase